MNLPPTIEQMGLFANIIAGILMGIDLFLNPKQIENINNYLMKNITRFITYSKMHVISISSFLVIYNFFYIFMPIRISISWDKLKEMGIGIDVFLAAITIGFIIYLMLDYISNKLKNYNYAISILKAVKLYFRSLNLLIVGNFIFFVAYISGVYSSSAQWAVISVVMIMISTFIINDLNRKVLLMQSSAKSIMTTLEKIVSSMRFTFMANLLNLILIYIGIKLPKFSIMTRNISSTTMFDISALIVVIAILSVSLFLMHIILDIILKRFLPILEKISLGFLDLIHNMFLRSPKGAIGLIGIGFFIVGNTLQLWTSK